MSEWKEYKLKDLTTKIGSGATPTGGSNAYKQSGISLIRSQNVLDFKFSDDGLAFIDEEQADDLKNVVVQENDVLLNITGDSVARICKVPNEVLPARVNQHVAIIRAATSKTKSDYLLYYLQSIKESLLIYSEIGGTRNALTKAMIENLDILLPPLPEQTAIAEVLSSLDDKIDLLYRQNKTLEQIAETLFRQCFIEEADDSWEIGNVNDLVKIQSGFAFKSSDFSDNGIYRIITIKNVQDGFLDSAKSDFLNSVPRNMPEHCSLQIGDILLSLTGNVGRCCLVDDDNLLLNQRVAKLKPLNERDWAFTYIMFRQTSMRRTLEELAKGTAQANLSPIETGALEIQIPPQKRHEYFSKEATPLIQKVLNNKLQIRTLTQLRDTLLPKLMSGEVRVNSELNK